MSSKIGHARRLDNNDENSAGADMANRRHEPNQTHQRGQEEVARSLLALRAFVIEIHTLDGQAGLLSQASTPLSHQMWAHKAADGAPRNDSKQTQKQNKCTRAGDEGLVEARRLQAGAYRKQRQAARIKLQSLW